MGLFIVNKSKQVFKDIFYIYNADNKFEYKRTSLSPKEVVQLLIASKPELANDICSSYNIWAAKGNATLEDVSTFVNIIKEQDKETNNIITYGESKNESNDSNKKSNTNEETVNKIEEAVTKKGIITSSSKEDSSSKKESEKTDTDASNDGEVDFIKPVNALDPVVIDNLDPDVKSSAIVKGYYSTDAEDPIQGAPSDQELNIEGINTPIIKYNNTVIDWIDIQYMKLDYTGFTPKLELSIYDKTNKIRFSQTPGINNEIDIILIFPVDEIYKKIALKFFIKEYKINLGTIEVKCEYKNIKASKKVITQIGSGNISLYDCLKTIAKDYGLGFAATKQCKEIEDKHPRLVNNQTILNFIEKQVDNSGVDVNSIFDCFIDVYNYINLINLSYVMKEDVNVKSLGIYSLTGVDQTTNGDTIKRTPHYVYRIITNSSGFNNENNLTIDEYENISNPDKLKNNGTSVNYYYVHPYGIGNGCNGIEQNEILIQENSVDGSHTDDYEYKGSKFMGFEMSETPILYQSALNKSYKIKLSSQQLKVKLHQPNLGLMRGQLVGVYLETSDISEKQTILNNSINALQATSNINEKQSDDSEDTANFKQMLLDNPGAPAPDITKSDIYYINGIVWEYKEYDEIVQYLYLIKKGKQTNYSNKYTIESINTQEVDTSTATRTEPEIEEYETNNKNTSLDGEDKQNDSKY